MMKFFKRSLTDGEVAELEEDINAALKASYQRLKRNRVRWNKLKAIHQRAVAAGFYEGKRERDGRPPGKRPPNPAYMAALNHMWRPAEKALKRKGLLRDETLRELFATSLEFSGHHCDNRVFAGHLWPLNGAERHAIFILVVPHDSPGHDHFRLPYPPRIIIKPFWAPLR
jgi:hypothetical protein